MLTCTKCGIKQDEIEFYNTYKQCKTCIKKYRENNKERDKQIAIIWRQNNKEIIKEKVRIKYYTEEEKAYRLKYNEENREKILLYKKEYYNKNKKEIITKCNNYIKNKRKNDSIFRFKCITRGLISNSFSRALKGKYKKSKRTEEILGCTIPEFFIYIQSIFTKGMTMQNNGQCEECWHIDHKIPIASAKTEEEVIKLNHYSNLQPMWSRENLSKGKKLKRVKRCYRLKFLLYLC